MSLKNIDIESALRRLADRRIEEAMRDGKFDNLQGAGKPLDLEPMPANEDARLAWWALRIFRQNDFTPDEVHMRKQLDGLRDELSTTTTERRVKALVAAHNGLVHQINTLGTNALPTAVAAVALDTELRKLRERQGSVSHDADPAMSVRQRHCDNHNCRARNSEDARFCRRCGSEFAA